MSTKSFLFIVTLLWLQSCLNKEISEPRLDFYKGNVLLPRISFITHDSVEVWIEYWPESNKNEKQVSKESIGTKHTIALFNLKPNTKYVYQITNVTDDNVTKQFSFTTDSIPAEVFKIRKDKIDTTVFKGYILIRRFFKSGADALVDNEGNIVWYNLYDTVVRRPFMWTDNQTILSIYDSAQIIETDISGDRIMDLNLKELNIPNKIHHEVLYDRTKQNIITITLDSAQYDLRKFGGNNDQYLRADGILVLSKEGKVKWEWNLLDFADVIKFNGSIDLKESWGHANSIALTPDNNYLISFRDFNQVWKINAQNGTVMWRLGKDGDFTLPKDSEFIGQHSAHFNPKGELVIFDNGNFKTRPNSRILAFNVDELSRKAVATTNITLPRALSSYRMCSAAWIAEGKYLVCTTRKDATLAVVNEKGEILWKAVADNASYRAYYIKEPFKLVQRK